MVRLLMAVPYPKQREMSRHILSAIIDERGIITKRGLSIYPGSLLLPTCEPDVLRSVRGKDSLDPTASILEALYPEQGIHVMRHLVAVVRVITDVSQHYPDHRDMDTDSLMVRLADKIRHFIRKCLADPHSSATDVKWDVVAYILCKLETCESVRLCEADDHSVCPSCSTFSVLWIVSASGKGCPQSGEPGAADCVGHHPVRGHYPRSPSYSQEAVRDQE